MDECAARMLAHLPRVRRSKSGAGAGAGGPGGSAVSTSTDRVSTLRRWSGTLVCLCARALLRPAPGDPVGSVTRSGYAGTSVLSDPPAEKGSYMGGRSVMLDVSVVLSSLLRSVVSVSVSVTSVWHGLGSSRAMALATRFIIIWGVMVLVAPYALVTVAPRVGFSRWLTSHTFSSSMRISGFLYMRKCSSGVMPKRPVGTCLSSVTEKASRSTADCGSRGGWTCGACWPARTFDTICTIMPIWPSTSCPRVCACSSSMYTKSLVHTPSQGTKGGVTLLSRVR
mmetsp:Transcript_25490/g.63973  ORF Transcript_25490/g.63973 Transcript_25490/m.63973 type:complete len:282 (+) Transcript_25490:358-1203(+)